MAGIYIVILAAVLLTSSIVPTTALGEDAAQPIVAAELPKSKQKPDTEKSPPTVPTVPGARAAPPGATSDKYRLRRLRELNKISEFMSQELDKLREASERLASHEGDSEEDESSKVSLRVDLPSLDRLDANSEVIVERTVSCSRCSRSDLARIEKQLESHMEKLRSKRDMLDRKQD